MGFETELQKSIYTVLNGNVSCSVYDDPPKKPAYPYIVIGDDSSIEFDTDDTVGRDIIATIHVWDNYNGKKRIKDIMGEVNTLLNRATYTVFGYDLIDSRFDSSNIFFEPDGKTRHGVISFRILLDEE